MGLYYAHGRICHLCELPIPGWTAATPPVLAGTRDHVIPLSLGGPRGGQNVKPAHACCNWARGRRGLYDQVKQHCRKEAVKHFAKHSQFIPEWDEQWELTRQLVDEYLKRRNLPPRQSLELR